MFKGFLSGLAASTLALVALALAVPLTPDPAAGSPAPAPVVLPQASSGPSGPVPGAAPAARPSAATPSQSGPIVPAGLPAMRGDRTIPRPGATPLPPSTTEAAEAPLTPPAGRPTASPAPSVLPGRSQERPLPPLAAAEHDPALRGQTRPVPPRVLMLMPAAPVLPPVHAPLLHPVTSTAPQITPSGPPPLVDITLRTDRLPQIGVPRLSGPARNGRSPARERYAMAVGAMPGDQPRVALLLLHNDGLPNLPVTLVFDPLNPDAPEAARAWRSGGGEVAILATGLPPDADARDAEVTLQNHLRLMPEAVALVDLPEGGFARDRMLSAQTIAILAEDGHGLVTHGNGLNAPVRMAESAGVAALTVAAHISSGAAPATTRRLLDRTALRAAQDGHAVIFGTASPEVLSLITDWLETGRGRDLLPVPLSVLLNGR